MPNATFQQIFQTATGNDPYGYQCRLANGTAGNDTSAACASQLVNIPTGLGKTAAVVLAWLWNRVVLQNEDWPRRPLMGGADSFTLTYLQTIQHIFNETLAQGIVKMGCALDATPTFCRVEHSLLEGCVLKNWALRLLHFCKHSKWTRFLLQDKNTTQNK